MSDRFEGVPAPDADELEEFDRLASEAAPLDRQQAGSSLHNQFRLAVPRLTKEIRRLRDLLNLNLERNTLRTEQRLQSYGSNRSWSDYDQGLDRLIPPHTRKPKREDVH